MSKSFFDMGKNIRRPEFETIHIDPSKCTVGIDFTAVEEIKTRNAAATAAMDRATERMRAQIDSTYLRFMQNAYGSFDGGTRIREPFVYGSRKPSDYDGKVIDLSPEDYREVVEVRELPEDTGAED